MSDNSTPSNCSLFCIFEVEPLIAKAPTTYIKLIQQLKYFGGSCEIFFGEQSAATTSIKALITTIDKYKQIFKPREVRETVFVSKLLFAIDTWMQMWLDKCMTQRSRNQVDDSILNFNSVINSTRFGFFDIILSPTFTTKIADNKPKKKKNKGGSDTHNDKDKEKMFKNWKFIPTGSVQTPLRRSMGNTFCREDYRTSCLGTMTCHQTKHLHVPKMVH